MKQKLIELAEMLKQKPEIKERLERLTFGCYIQVDYNIWVFLKQSETWKIQYWNKSYLCYSDDDSNNPIIKIIGHEPAYHDVLEYFGEDISLKYLSLEIRKKREYKKWEIHWGDVYNVFEIKLSPWSLSDQTDETLDEIISLCKNVWK